MPRALPLVLAACMVLPVSASLAQGTDAEPPADPADVISVDAIITALYDVISGPAGQARDWDRFRTLMLPSAQLIPLGRRPDDGQVVVQVLSVEDYIRRAGPYLEQNGFFETEIARTEERYGNLVHAFSTYESRNSADDAEPFMRGINSIQVLYQGDRWWIANIAWQPEWEGLPIPGDYLQ
ncbi:MAG: hypothetical protein R3247_11040 [Rhodothermales bacterium]|nr:hypothetical protein [Rhodothermales bacterium]